jgi:hypothetical protein
MYNNTSFPRRRAVTRKLICMYMCQGIISPFMIYKKLISHDFWPPKKFLSILKRFFTSDRSWKKITIINCSIENSEKNGQNESWFHGKKWESESFVKKKSGEKNFQNRDSFVSKIVRHNFYIYGVIYTDVCVCGGGKGSDLFWSDITQNSGYRNWSGTGGESAGK